MARLEDKQKRELPPPPAATRRGANPWKFSETARKREPAPEVRGPDLLDSLVTEASENKAAEAGSKPWIPDEHSSARGPEQRSRFGLWFMVVVGVGILIFLRVMFEAGDGGDWVGAIGPLLLIAFVAHGWWRARQKRRKSEKTRTD